PSTCGARRPPRASANLSARRILIPDRIVAILGMELRDVFRHVPERIVDRRARIVRLLRMAERTPPILHRLGEIRGPFQRGDAERTVERAVEHPESARARPARERMDVVFHDLRLVAVAMAV